VLGVRSPVGVSGTRDERIATVAELQRGHIAREQLRTVGISDSATKRLIAFGRLIRVHEAVYAVRPLIDVPFAREAAALLACEPNALLSHGSAAAVWKFGAAADGPVELTVANRRHRRTPGIAHTARGTSCRGT
jgi:hypothetical protein